FAVSVEASGLHAALLEQSKLWQSRGRDDLAAEALDKLLVSFPNHPEGLGEMALLHLRAGRIEDVRRVLEQLRKNHPRHANIARIEALLRLEGPDRARLEEARMLSRAGRID